MMTEQTSQLLSKIDAFLNDTGMGESYFGKCAVGNSELVGRLRNGGKVLQDTGVKVVSFIEAERLKRNVPEPSPVPEGVS
ncbi:hypothetical protein GGQ73_003045 [Rhizobium skierniewicense]|uniref:Uncharacterized protein n=1 Tax=Rhizobium skierniewicense TaxID=984260 RepID=A0A7W6C951_9HYPH|nr:hypothetical protein [Rhizobium skierniewicense]MBB3947081.1 hypothetical protein [Rhizobium skierniewicense]